MSAGGRIYKWTKMAYMCEKRQIVRLLWSPRCVEAIAAVGPSSLWESGGTFCDALPSGGLSQWEPVSQGTRLDLPWLYQSRLLGCCRLISILGSFLVAERLGGFQVLSQWNTLKDEINTSENTAEPSTTSCCSGFGLRVWARMTLSNMMPCIQTLTAIHIEQCGTAN